MAYTTLNAQLGKIRRTVVNGRAYRVAPLTMIVPGVLPGSNGPLYYPAEEVSRSPADWNGVPLVVGHPKDEQGNFVSARSPEVMALWAVGTVYNARYRKGALRAEGWFDEEALRRVEPRILSALERGLPIELSTGLSLQAVGGEGVYNGKSYTATAVGYKPDHLAVLLGEKGACSIEDGCGVLVNEGDEETANATQSAKPKKKPSQQLDMTAEKACKILEDGEVGGEPLTAKQKRMFGAKCGQHREKTANEEPMDASTSEAKARKRRRRKRMAYSRKKIISYLTANCDCWKGQEQTLNAMDDEMMAKMMKMCKEMASMKATNNELTLTVNAAKEALELPEDLTGNHLTIEIREKAKRRKKIKAQTDEPEEEVKEGDEDDAEGEAPKKKGKAAQPKKGAEKEEAKATTNERQPMTDKELLAALSPELRATINRSVERDKRHKAQLIERLTANLEEPLKEALLPTYNGLAIEALEALLAAKRVQSPIPSFQEEEPAEGLPHYAGAAGAPLFANRSTFDAGEDLDMVPPVVNYDLGLPQRFSLRGADQQPTRNEDN